MDIQIKINGEKIKIDKTSKILFKIKEYRDVFFSYEDNKSNSYILIETFDESQKKIVKNQEIMINQYLNKLKDGISLPAGEYPIIYFDEEKEYDFKFIVAPSAISEEDLENIKINLENFSEGISKDVSAIRRIGEINKEFKNDKLLFITNLIEEKTKLRLSLENILKNPIMALEKTYVKQDHLKKYDYRTIKNMCKDNINIFTEKRPKMILNRKVIETIENNENLWLIQSLNKIMEFLFKVNGILIKEKNIKNEKLVKASFEKSEIESKLLKWSRGNINIGKTYFSLTKIREKNLNSEIEELIKINELIENYSFEILEIIKIIKSFIDNFKLKTNKRKAKINFKILKNHNYSYIKKIVEKIYVQSSKNLKNKSSFQNKQTFDLYEYYSFILIIDIFKDLNFVMSEDIAIISELENDIRKNYEYSFKNENGFLIKLSYDKEINEINNEEGFTCSNSHNKPDFLISLYDKKNNLIKCLIIEIKCCLSQYIYNKNYDTKIYEQIKSYSYYHYKFKNRIDREIISKVLVLYPTQEKIIRNEEYLLEKFIDIKPALTLKETKGYEILKQEIYRFLSENMGN